MGACACVQEPPEKHEDATASGVRESTKDAATAPAASSSSAKQVKIEKASKSVKGAIKNVENDGSPANAMSPNSNEEKEDEDSDPEMWTDEDTVDNIDNLPDIIKKNIADVMPSSGFRKLEMPVSGTNEGKFYFQYKYGGSWYTSSYQLSADGGIGIQNGHIVAKQNGMFWTNRNDTWGSLLLLEGYYFICKVKQSNGLWKWRYFYVNRHVDATANGVKWQ